VYRSGELLYELIERLRRIFAQREKSFEVLLVEDCGGDNSWQIITDLVESDRRLRGIRLSRNYGQHNALLCGIRAARGQFIVTMDDDLQHPPEELPKLLSKTKEGFDVVYGATITEPHGLLRGMASRITKWVLSNAMGAATAGKVSAWRVFPTRLRDAFSDYRSPFVNIDVMLTWASMSFAYVNVEHHPRTQGVSGYTLRMLVRHAINLMTGFSTLPLQLASFIGFLFAGLGLFILVYVVARYFYSGVTVPGFAFLASIVSVFSGAQLLAIGIIGEYLARIHFRTLGQPPYQIREKLND
jgi:undecaprenyl-phosphate 4-deoxy-4-formamido-L-arabinose transferase